MHRGKTDTETNFVATVGFTTKVDRRETDGNNEICFGVRFAWCIIRVKRNLKVANERSSMKLYRNERTNERSVSQWSYNYY